MASAAESAGDDPRLDIEQLAERLGMGVVRALMEHALLPWPDPDGRFHPDDIEAAITAAGGRQALVASTLPREADDGDLRAPITVFHLPSRGGLDGRMRLIENVSACWPLKSCPGCTAHVRLAQVHLSSN